MRISDWSSDVCSSDLHCFAVHHLASTSGGDDKYTIPRSVRNRVPANARLYRHFFSAIYRCGDDRAIRLGQKGFGRETYLCTPRGTSGGIEGNYPYVVGGVFLHGCRWVKIGTGYLLPIHHRSEEHTSELQSL